MVPTGRAYVAKGRSTRVAVDVGGRGDARVVVPAGAYAGITAWPSRALFLEALDAAIRGPWRYLLRRTNKDATSPDSFMRWARREAAGADSSTGRGMRESVEIIAADLGCSIALVRRCRRIGRDLGIYRDVVGGRLLRLSERLEAHVLGSKQRGVTGERAFCVPRALRPLLARIQRTRPNRRAPARGHPGDSATHPRRGPVSTNSHSGNNSPWPRKRGERTKKEGRFATRSSTKNLAPGEALAREVVRRLPYGHRIAPRRLASVFADFEAHQWTPADVIAACDRVLSALGRRTPAVVSSPGGYLRWILQHVDATAYEPGPVRPDWCGRCQHTTRLVELDDGRMQRCPNCHPLARET